MPSLRGLQKTKFYCQLCEKQCRDQNGFDNHLHSESHLRQVELFTQDEQGYINRFSKEFEEGFLEVLRVGHNHNRVMARLVYNQYIKNKHHVRIHATRWHTLTNFVQYLGNEKICEIDQETDPAGLPVYYIQLIEKDVEREKREENMRKAEARRRMLEQRLEEEYSKRFEEASKVAKPTTVQSTNISREIDEETGAVKAPEGKKIVLNLGGKQPQGQKQSVFKDLKPTQPPPSSATSVASVATVPANPVDRTLEEIKAQIEAKKARKRPPVEQPAQPPTAKVAKKAPTRGWLQQGVVVKVMHKELKDGKYYKEKGVVETVEEDGFVGKVRLLNVKATLQLDQQYLETVLPKLGGRVVVVNPDDSDRGAKGELVEIHVDRFAADVKLGDGRKRRFPYEEICKLHEA